MVASHRVAGNQPVLVLDGVVVALRCGFHQLRDYAKLQVIALNKRNLNWIESRDATQTSRLIESDIIEQKTLI